MTVKIAMVTRNTDGEVTSQGTLYLASLKLDNSTHRYAFWRLRGVGMKKAMDLADSLEVALEIAAHRGWTKAEDR